jgi:Dolichyl-phosphate-mannose-protein mannosyltransferase
MEKSTVLEQPAVSPVAGKTDLSTLEKKPFESVPRTGRPWSAAAILGLLALALFWALKLYTTWGAWGNLTIDSGREMYVPAVLAKGKTLYRDIWYLYGPAAPYLNSLLFRCFGARLEVLYWAGSLAVLGSAVLLFLTGRRLFSPLAGWTAGAIVLAQAFHASLFCFPLPYSFASVYGCLIACLFLYFVVQACFSPHWGWMFGAGSAAAAALLLKLEFGTACYASLFLLLLVRFLQRRSWRPSIRDLSMILPGVAVCVAVIAWMISLKGVEFITQENIMSWPTSYFMKTFGSGVLAQEGFKITGSSLGEAALRAAPVGATLAAVYIALHWKRQDFRAQLAKVAALSVSLALLGWTVSVHYFPSERVEQVLRSVFFPADMVLYDCSAALVACGYWLWKRESFDGRRAATLLLLTFSGLLAFRILMKMTPDEVSIYYNGPAVLSFLLLLFLILPKSGYSKRLIFAAQLFICCGCLTPVALRARVLERPGNEFVPLPTERGTVRVSERVKQNYVAAIQFMKEQAERGESVLSVPEDTSLYFLSGVDCPTRVFAFTPGLVSPGKMTDELIQEIDQRHVRYLIWSNRTFSEYGAPRFGIDFNPELGGYFKAHFHRSSQLVPGPVDYRQLNFVVWERNDEGSRQ